jgi:hypothetical protein
MTRIELQRCAGQLVSAGEISGKMTLLRRYKKFVCGHGGYPSATL